MRKTIKAAAPKAEERISYGIPYYEHNGRLAYFAVAKEHIGLYIPPPVIGDHENELKGYKTAKGTVRFPLNQDLPVKLIQKLIKARLKVNLERSGLASKRGR